MVRRSKANGKAKFDLKGKEKYREINTSFSGTDIIATIKPCGGSPVVLGELQTITYSIYRPMNQVYAMGTVGARGYTQGHRTIAGSLIFTVFDRHALKYVMDSYEDTSLPISGGEMMPDELPPFDVVVTFLNEFGLDSVMTIKGVKIITEGQTMSIEDMVTENTMQYIAKDIDLMESNGLNNSK